MKPKQPKPKPIPPDPDRPDIFQYLPPMNLREALLTGSVWRNLDDIWRREAEEKRAREEQALDDAEMGGSCGSDFA